MSDKFRIQKAVGSAFSGDTNGALVEQYLGLLREELKRNIAHYQRSIYFLLFLILTSELLFQASITELAIGPLKVTDLSLVQKLLPVAITYGYYDLLSVASIRRVQVAAYDEILNNHHQTIYESQLSWVLRPYSVFAADNLFSILNHGRITSIVGRLSLITGSLLLIGPIAYAGHASWRNFVFYDGGDILFWMASAISLVLVFQSLLVLIQAGRLSKLDDA